MEQGGLAGHEEVYLGGEYFGRLAEPNLLYAL